MPRGTYHFTDLVDKLDLYGGIMLGAEIVTDKAYGDWEGTDYSANSAVLPLLNYSPVPGIISLTASESWVNWDMAFPG